uniref:Uncharacterized protein n=1 Tax=Oryza sativa subsp. japonica TaxID=39947 RepID=Q67VY8_ORYSJ|nr:hypothetical protein [Oryza sativa Japonica Group]
MLSSVESRKPMHQGSMTGVILDSGWTNGDATRAPLLATVVTPPRGHATASPSSPLELRG